MPDYDPTREAAERVTVVGSFEDREAAEAAVQRLREEGFPREEIGFATREDAGDTVLVEEHGNAAGSGAAGGAMTGAVAGGALAWLGLTAIPAIGPFIAAGAIGTALLAAGTGAVTGGLLGGLLGLGIPRHRAEYHEEQLRTGRSLVTVQTGEPGIAERILREFGATSVDVEQVEQLRRTQHVEPAEHAEHVEHAERREPQEAPRR